MLQRLGFPDVGPHRRFVSALAIDALGSGVWMPLSMLYFLHQTSLSLVQLGLAMTIANAVALLAVPWLGVLVDRLGPRLVMQAGNVGAAVAFLLYPFAHSMAAVTVLVFCATATRQAFWTSLGPMVTQITQPGERELWFGFLQAMRNAGYGVGGVLSAVALTIGTSLALQAVVVANAASYVVAAVLMLGVVGGGRVAREVTADGAVPGRWWTAFTDRGYRALIAVIFCYALATMTLNVSMPVYFVRTLGLPGWVPGTVFVINTVMIGLGQGLVVRAMTGSTRRRVLQAAVGFTVASYVLFLVAAGVSIAAGVVVVLAAAFVYTLAEMTAGPVVSALAAEAPPAEQRGRYLAATQLAWGGSAAVAPLFYSALLAQGAVAAWVGPILICVGWAMLIELLGRRMPQARRTVTNAAEGDTLGDAEVGGAATAEAPTTS